MWDFFDIIVDCLEWLETIAIIFFLIFVIYDWGIEKLSKLKKRYGTKKLIILCIEWIIIIFVCVYICISFVKNK